MKEGRTMTTTIDDARATLERFSALAAFLWLA